MKKKVAFRYDSVGSFLRPEKLKQARKDYETGVMDKVELREIEDECIVELVDKQKNIGLQCLTDGEFRRSYWHLDFFWGFTGVEHNMMEQGYLFHGEETRPDSARLTGKLRFSDEHPFLKDYHFLNQLTGSDFVAKQCIPAPAQFYAELVRGTNENRVTTYYPDRKELFQDISKAYREAILAFYALGCRTIQLDDCTWGMLCDKSFWSTMANGDYNPESLQKLYLELNNEALVDLPEDLVVTTHVCRGNYHSTWATSGGYEPVAEILFGRENVKAFYLEFDDERSGGFEPLKYIPEGKDVVLGLFTSKKGNLENKETIVERVKEASQYVPLDHLHISPQCGFASTEEGNILTEKEQWQKLSYIREIAEEIWQDA